MVQSPEEALARRIAEQGHVVLRGIEQLRRLRDALGALYTAGGLRVEFDPSSSPKWVDYLMVALPSAAEGALKGAAWGLGLGTLFGKPAVGAALGALLGAAHGASTGVESVRQGCRIRVRDEGGVPVAWVEALAR